MIEGVMVKQLKVIPDERGRLMEILRCDEEPHPVRLHPSFLSQE